MVEADHIAARGWLAGDAAQTWRRGRYHIQRSKVFDLDPEGTYVYTSWFKANADSPSVLIHAPERRLSFDAAEADCAAHYRSQSATSQQQGVLL